MIIKAFTNIVIYISYAIPARTMRLPTNASLHNQRLHLRPYPSNPTIELNDRGVSPVILVIQKTKYTRKGRSPDILKVGF